LVGPRQISLIRESNSWRKEEESENPLDLGIVARLPILRKKKIQNISALADGPVVHTLLNLWKLIVHRRNSCCLHLWWNNDINNLIFFSRLVTKKVLKKQSELDNQVLLGEKTKKSQQLREVQFQNLLIWSELEYTTTQSAMKSEQLDGWFG